MTVRLGVVGAGAIGQDHIRRCNEVVQGSKVVAINDIDAERTKKFIADKGLDAKFYANGHDLIKADDVDAVLVTCWGPSHEEFVLSAIAAGKPVFCEKPLAVTAEACKGIVDAEMKGGKRLVQVGFMRPFDAGYRALKAVIDSKEIGAPLIVNCKHFNPAVDDNYTTPMAITDTLVHELDVLRWLLDDDYKSVQVIFPRKTSAASSHLQDPQVILMETHKGLHLNVQVFVNDKYGYDIQCEVVCESGIASLPEPMAVPIRKDAALSHAILMDWKQRFIDAYDVELQAFVDNVISGRFSVGASAWDGYAAAVACDACVKAQTTRAVEPVSMPPRPAFYGA